MESEEESGSPHLVQLLKEAKDIIKKPDVCFCLDTGCFDFEKLWVASSLRGMAVVDMTVEGSALAYHSGLASGIVPETFTVACDLLSRIDDTKTGKVAKEFHTKIPKWALE